MNKYQTLRDSLASTGKGQMKVFGNSMLPLIKSGTLLHYEVADEYNVGDIVFCKVNGKYIDAHKITKKKNMKSIGHVWYMIANNHGWENGWTRQVYAKVVTGTITCY